VSRLVATAVAAVALGLPSHLQGGEEIVVVAETGGVVVGGDGLPVAALGIPIADGAGRIAFTGSLDDGGDGDGFVWRDGEILWRNSFAPPPRPVGAAPFMGLGDGGEFVFRTLLQGLDTLWSHHGELLRTGQQAPGLEPGAIIEFNRRAMVTPSGTAFWVSGFRDGPGTAGQGRVLYASADAAPGDVQVVLRSDDLVAGLPIGRPRGLDLEFRVSRDVRHHIHVLELDTGSELDDGALLVDGELALREGQRASGRGSHWSRFRRVSINNSGDYLFSATVDGPPWRDVVLGYNGEVALRENQRVGGVRLKASAAIQGLDLDDDGRAVHLWSTDGFGAEYLFFACDAARLDESVAILTTGDTIGTQSAVFTFNDTAHGSVLWLTPGAATIQVEVTLARKAGDRLELRDAILAVPLPDCDG
jgi:hypothetical protein